MKFSHWTGWLGVILLAALPYANAQERAIEPAPPITEAQRKQVREARGRMLEETPRIIFNSDGNVPIYDAAEPTPQAMIDGRLAGLLGTQTDVVAYCPWSAGFGMFTHRTEVGERFTTREGIFKKNITAALFEQGTDPLQIAAEFAHANDMDVFFSMRMNDTHDSSLKKDGSLYYGELFSEWKEQNPDKLHGTPKDRPRNGRWSGVDYGATEVRELAYQFVEEACRKYPIQGIELDFCRHPLLFRSVSQTGAPATDKELSHMTELMQRIRQMTEREAVRRGGEPYLIAIRVPDSVEACRFLGIDLERWLAEGLIDILIPSGYFHLSHWQDSVELAHQHGVEVYAGLAESRVRLDGNRAPLRPSRQSYRARAAQAWEAGVDGIYIFNIYNPAKQHFLKDVGSPETLTGLDKIYFASVQGTASAKNWLMPAEPRHYFSRPTLTPEDGVSLKPGATFSATFTIGDDLSAEALAAAGVSTPSVICRLRFKPTNRADHIEVNLNGRTLTDGKAKGELVVFQVSPEFVNDGPNTFAVELDKAAGDPIELQDIQLLIDYPDDKTPWPEAAGL